MTLELDLLCHYPQPHTGHHLPEKGEEEGEERGEEITALTMLNLLTVV